MEIDPYVSLTLSARKLGFGSPAIKNPNLRQIKYRRSQRINLGNTQLKSHLNKENINRTDKANVKDIIV
jgi:hypothetical protein